MKEFKNWHLMPKILIHKFLLSLYISNIYLKFPRKIGNVSLHTPLFVLEGSLSIILKKVLTFLFLIILLFVLKVVFLFIFISIFLLIWEGLLLITLECLWILYLGNLHIENNYKIYFRHSSKPFKALTMLNVFVNSLMLIIMLW